MSQICIGKNSWPELVGVPGDVAVKVIEKENCLVDAVIVVKGQPGIGPFSCNRVWVPVDEDGIVFATPVMG